jgi:hypothetical protein
MPLHNPIHKDVIIKPIFATINPDTGIETIIPFKGISSKDEGFLDKDDNDDVDVDEEAEESAKLICIFDVLHHYFNLNSLEFNEFNDQIINGRLEIALLSNAQLKLLEGIYEYTGDYPINIDDSYLKFEIIGGDSECNCDMCYPDPDEEYENRKLDAKWGMYDD